MRVVKNDQKESSKSIPDYQIDIYHRIDSSGQSKSKRTFSFATKEEAVKCLNCMLEALQLVSSYNFAFSCKEDNQALSFYVSNIKTNKVFMVIAVTKTVTELVERDQDDTEQ